MIYIGNTLVDVKTTLEPIEEKDVNFYDYEGTLLHSYTKAEVLAMTSMPPLPNRSSEGLTCEGWNYTLAEIQTYAAISDLKWVGVGATYYTSDDKTHIFAEPDSDFPTIYLYVKSNVANDTVIDWGDGNTETLTTTTVTQLEHTYTTFGVRRDITIYSATSTHTFPQYICGSAANNRKSIIKEIRFSKNCPLASWYTSTTVGRFYMMINLEYLCINSYQFSGNMARFVTSAYSLKHLNCPSTMALYQYGVYGCYNIKIVTAKNWSPYYNFRYSYSLEHGLIGSTSNYTYTSYCLKDLYISEGVTSITANFAVSGSIKELVIPSTVTTIGASSFTSLYSCLKIYCKPTNPPSIQTSSFSNITDSCIIFVPRASLSNYTSASNWSDLAAQIKPYDF